MSDITVQIKLTPPLDAKQDNIVNLVQSIFNDFSSFLTMDESTNIPHITSVIEFLPTNAIHTNITARNLIDTYKSDTSYDILLIGIFRHLFGDQNSFTLQSSVLEEGSYVFVNYDPQELLLTNEKLIPVIILNEFVNYLFSFNEKQLETHSGPCIRTINQPDINDSIVLLNSSHYSLDIHKFCSKCSEKILTSFSKLGLDSTKTIQQTPQPKLSTEQPVPEEIVKENPIPTNLVARATRPPPRRTQLELDPNRNLSFAQRKQINSILKDLGLLKEPLGDSEYLEVRKRFFEGKISEQVFLQILKRKSK